MHIDEEVFVETGVFRTAVHVTSERGMLVLSGPPASGKSCLAHAVLRHHQASGFTPLVLHRSRPPPLTVLWRLCECVCVCVCVCV